MQLYELAGGREPVPLTALSEPVGRARYLPGGDGIVIEVDRGGNERFQIYRLGRQATAQGPVTELGQLDVLVASPAHVHQLAGISPDGRCLAFVSNRANGVDFDVWVMDLFSGTQQRIFDEGGWCQPGSGFSPDGKWLSVLRPGPRPLDTDLLLIEVRTGHAHIVLPHPGEAALVGAPAWLSNDRFLFSADVGRDNAVVLAHDLRTRQTDPLARPTTNWSTDVLTNPAGNVACFVENRNGACRVTLCTTCDSQAEEVEVALDEPGVVERHNLEPPKLSPDGSTLYYTLTTPRQAGDVWAYDCASATSRRLTRSTAVVPADQLVTPDVTEVTSFDGERVPLFVYRPRFAQSRPPVVVLVHGGPEGQSVLGFDPVLQGMVAAGYGVVVPNVRGSTGYGKRYASLDDTTKRLDSVRDLAAVHGVVADFGFDPRRAALWGGSYGGYMVLAGLAFQPELWAAGVDIVGISDLISFLENTSAYRRAHREREYGSLANDREFLASASPLRHAHAIKAPLLMIHGRNDPRVPVSETEQLAAELTRRNIRCELLIYEDEGHGLARLDNRLDAYPKALTFLDEVLCNKMSEH